MHAPLRLRSLALALLLAPLAAGTQGPPPPPGGGPAGQHGGPPDGPPPDAPRLSSEHENAEPRGLRVNAEGAFDGLTLFAPLNSRTAYLIDMDGTVVHEWEADSSPAGGMYLLDDGRLLRCGREDEDPAFRGGGIGGRLQLLAPDGEVVWDHDLADETRCQHHDVEPLPNGNLLVIVWERMSADEAVALGRDPDQVADAGLWTDAIYELRPVLPDGAEVVWAWRSRDHLVQDRDPELPDHGEIAAHSGRIDLNADHRDEPPRSAAEVREQEELEEQMAALGYVGGYDEEDEEEPEEDDDADRRRGRVGGDWLHTNAVSYDPELDLIALSTPHLCELWVIDHSTTTAEAASNTGGRRGRGGDLLWRWGNPRVHGAGEDADKRLFYQHDPTWQRGPDGDVRLLFFNNGRGRADGDYSSVDELVLPFTDDGGFRIAPGEPHGPAEPAWSYSDPDTFFSAFISGAQRLPNGNTLICSGVAGRIFEVTRAGEIVWDYRNPLGGDVEPPDHAGKAPPLALFRATRLPRDHPGVRAVLATH